MILDELKELNRNIELPQYTQFVHLKAAITAEVEKLLKKNSEAATRTLKQVIRMNHRYINTQHPEFIGGKPAIEQVEAELKAAKQSAQAHTACAEKPKESGGSYFSRFRLFGAANGSEPAQEAQPVEPQPTPQQEFETLVIKKLVRSYFTLTKKTLGDIVPKTIWTLLVKKVRATQSLDSLQTKLTSKLYREERFQLIFAEDEAVPKRRSNCLALMQSLKEALPVLNEVLNYATN